MKKLSSAALAIFLGLASPVLAAAGGVDRALLLADRGDRELRHVFLPSARNVHGELRLLRRGDAWVLQTLLYTPQLRRGVQRMRRKELYAWPEGVAGWADSQRYLADLESATDHALGRAVDQGRAAGARQTLLIELVLGESDALWAFYDVELAARGSRQLVTARAPFLVRDASRSYLRRALMVQANTGFGMTPEELAELPQ